MIETECGLKGFGLTFTLGKGTEIGNNYSYFRWHYERRAPRDSILLRLCAATTFENEPPKCIISSILIWYSYIHCVIDFEQLWNLKPTEYVLRLPTSKKEGLKYNICVLNNSDFFRERCKCFYSLLKAAPSLPHFWPFHWSRRSRVARRAGLVFYLFPVWPVNVCQVAVLVWRSLCPKSKAPKILQSLASKFCYSFIQIKCIY